jgi:hypothetical protein
VTSSKRTKSQMHDELKVVAHWQYTQEYSPAFKRLMLLLLWSQSNQPEETSWPEKEHQNEK